MSEVSAAIIRWLEEKRRTERTSAAVVAVLALGVGSAVFLLMTLVVYFILITLCGSFALSSPWVGLAALGLGVAVFVRGMKNRRDPLDVSLDPTGSWIIKDIISLSPRLILEGLRQIRRYEDLGELHLSAAAGALAYLAVQNAAIDWEELVLHCPELPSERLKKELSLLDGVLFLGDDASRLLLMEPFRLRLRAIVGQGQHAWERPEPARPRPEPSPRVVPVNEPEKLSAYELLGLSSSATAMEIKMAYRKRVKECHPDLFAGMDQEAKALAERWTKALNAAYATLNPRHRGSSTRRR